MTIQEAYKRFLLKVNKNDSNVNTRISEAQFVLLFNEQSIVWLSEKLEKNLSTDAIDELEELIDYQDLDPIESRKNETYFPIPTNFYEYISSTVTASTPNCSRQLTTFKFKPKNKGIYLQDAFTKPSFDWEETLLSLNRNRITIYTDNFKADTVHLEYYRYPDKVDIEGYINVNGSMSTTIHPTLSDKSVIEIINRCASESAKNVADAERYQLSETRLLKEK